jgi:hypothetical protein
MIWYDFVAQYNQDMSDVSFKEKTISWGLILMVAAITGWLLYRFVISDRIALRDAPPLTPHVISRVEWGARLLDLEAVEEFGAFDSQTNPAGVLTYPDDLRSVLNTIVVHHSATAYSSPNEIQALHMDGRGFADVAYHFMITTDGTIYEGREIDIRGAHVQSFNTGSVGIVLLGNFNEDQPTETQLTSLRALVDYLSYAYEIKYLAGHKDYPNQSPDGTECPGDNLYPLLIGMAWELGMKYGIEGYVAPE